MPLVVTFQYELMRGYNVFGPEKSQREPFFEVMALFGHDLDMIGISTYPGFIYEDPETFPSDYFDPLTKTGKPVGIFETAWPATDSRSETDQDIYLKWLLSQVPVTGFQLIIWTSANDTLRSSDRLGRFEIVEGIPAWFGSLGLWDIDSKPKLAARTWQLALR